MSRYFPGAELVVHASYDRAFQTPEFENILLSSSPDVVSLSDQVLRLPVKPSHGNYYELGFTKGFFRRARLDVNYFDRRMDTSPPPTSCSTPPSAFPLRFRNPISTARKENWTFRIGAGSQAS